MNLVVRRSHSHIRSVRLEVLVRYFEDDDPGSQGHEGMKRSCNRASVPYKMPGAIGKTQKSLQLFPVRGNQPVSDHRHLLWVNLDAVGLHEKSQKGNRQLVDLTNLSKRKSIVTDFISRTQADSTDNQQGNSKVALHLVVHYVFKITV